MHEAVKEKKNSARLLRAWCDCFCCQLCRFRISSSGEFSTHFASVSLIVENAVFDNADGRCKIGRFVTCFLFHVVPTARARLELGRPPEADLNKTEISIDIPDQTISARANHF